LLRKLLNHRWSRRAVCETLAAQAPQPPVVEEGGLRPSRNLRSPGWD